MHTSVIRTTGSTRRGDSRLKATDRAGPNRSTMHATVHVIGKVLSNMQGDLM